MDSPEVYVGMPDSLLPSALPKGWTVSRPANPLTVVGPELDLRMFFFSELITLATAAIALWNTVYLDRATNALRENGYPVDPALRKHLSPLGWEHINLTGDYQWRNTAKLGKSKFRPLRQQ
jgi:hypothetical protein